MLRCAGRVLHPVTTAAVACTAAAAASAAPAVSALAYQHAQIRRFIDGKIGADPDEVAELIESNIVRPSRDEQDQSPRRLLTTRREALSLYREVLRYSNLFVHKDEHGRVWRDVLRANARAEFEAARFEPDPELINRMIVTGRDAVQRIVGAYMKKRDKIIEEEAQRPPLHWQ